MTKELLLKGIKLITYLEDKHISYEELKVIMKMMEEIKKKKNIKKDLTSITTHIRLLHGHKEERKRYLFQRPHAR